MGLNAYKGIPPTRIGACYSLLSLNLFDTKYHKKV